MTTLQAPQPAAPPPPPVAGIRTMAELLEHLGGLPPERVRLRPTPGTATEQDVLDVDAHEDRHCELIDGVLVEKTMGIEESLLATELGALVSVFVKSRKLGIVTGEGGTVGLLPGQVRIPDVAFFSWDRLPGRRVPKVPIPAIYPDLAIEVLSVSNTKREMARKLREYFTAGTRLVWYIDPGPRTVAVYTRPEQVTVLTEADTLTGAEVLPGFQVPLRELFAALDRSGEDDPNAVTPPTS